VRQFAIFAATTAAVIAVVGITLDQVFTGPDNHHALVVSAVLALVVQLVAFAVSRRLRRWNVIGAWGLGVAIRFVALVIYAVGLKSWALAPVPALVSFVIFLFLSTLAEPWLLRSPAPSR
jgi:steroid 5-alpha reductase family enzyme